MMKHPQTENKSLIDDWAMKGASNTVGAAGGWILDGGFGLFPKLNGMGVDNVISMKVVLANGDIKTCYGFIFKFQTQSGNDLFTAPKLNGLKYDTNLLSLIHHAFLISSFS